jgi:predicted acetyltransferase
MQLVWPARDHLSSYVDALRRGWSPDNLRPQEAQEELARIAVDADGFLASRVDREAQGGPIRLSDGTLAQRLPGYIRWLWDSEFCGVIGFRWQRGTPALPPHVLGHIGYTVVPWKRRRGYATEALRQLLDDARTEGLPYVELTTDPDNLPSRTVITKNGGVLVERFTKVAGHGGGPGLRWRITL